MLDFQQVLEDLLLLLPVGDEGVPALVPLNVVAVGLLPGGENLYGFQAEADFGGVGVGGADAADGGLVGALSGAGELVNDQDFQAGVGHEEGGGQADAPGTDNHHVVGLGGHGAS